MGARNQAFRYLNRTKDRGLRFIGEADGAPRCYVDSDYAGCPDDYKLTCGLVITMGGAVDWRSRKQESTAQSTTDPEYYAFGVGCMTLTQISHLLNALGILTIPHEFSDSQSLTASINNRIYRGTEVAHIATKYYFATDTASDGEICMSYVLTAEMLADCFTKPLPNPAFLKQCAAIGIIRIGLRTDLDMYRIWQGIGLGNGLGTFRNAGGNGIGTGTGNRVGIAVGKKIE